MNGRQVVFSLLIIGFIVYCLIPEEPTRKVLVVIGCSDEEANWEYFEMDEFPGSQSEFEGADDLVWNRSGSSLALEGVEYGVGPSLLRGKKDRYRIGEGLQSLSEYPDFVLREAPETIKVMQGSTGVKLRWQLTCR